MTRGPVAVVAVAVLLLTAAPASAQDIDIEYAEGFDFERIETFRCESPPELVEDDPIAAARILDMIRDTLKEGGLVEVDDDADLFVTYEAAINDREVTLTRHYGYGGSGPGWSGWRGTPASVNRTMTITEGTLVVDAYSNEDKVQVWRGTGTVKLKKDPEKQMRQVRSIIDKLSKRWDKILRGRAPRTESP